jgi:hypothetical protein
MKAQMFSDAKFKGEAGLFLDAVSMGWYAEP